MFDPVKSFTVTEDQLTEVARIILMNIKPGDIVGLTGEMGAGKTTFVRALLQKMGYDFSHGFSSPTFSIQNEYQLPGLSVLHLDLYRLQSEYELAEMDLLMNPNNQSITFIEWAGKFESAMRMLTSHILIKSVPEDSSLRSISFFYNVNADSDPMT